MRFNPEIQEWFNICKPKNVTHLINKIKNKNYVTASINAEKSFWQNTTSFHDYKLSAISMEGTHLNTIKYMYNKPTDNIILDSEILKYFPLILGTRQGCPLLPSLYNLLLEVLDRITRQEKRNRKHPK